MNEKDNKLEMAQRPEHVILNFFILICFVMLTSVCSAGPKDFSNPALDLESKFFSELSPKDKIIWNRGEISNQKYFAGGVLGTIVGFGSGHAIQKRFDDKGSYFLVGEGLGLGGLIVGGAFACGVGYSTNYGSTCSFVQNASLAIFLGTKIWEIFDLWVIPPFENARFHELKETRKGFAVKAIPTILPGAQDGFAVGLLMSF